MMKTLDSSIRSQRTTLAVATAISLSFASLAEAETVRIKLPASKQGPAPVQVIPASKQGPPPVRVISSGNEGPAPARVKVTSPPISKQHALELQNAQRARKMAEMSRMAQELRDNNVGANPGLLNQPGGMARRQPGSAADRAGNLPPPIPGTDYNNPLGPASAGIDARLRGNSPRAKVVGPGALPTDSTGLAGYDVQTTTFGSSTIGHYGSVDTMTLTIDDPRTGATRFTYTVGYQTSSGRLAAWMTESVDSMGNAEVTSAAELKYAGPNSDVPVVTTTEWDPALEKMVSSNTPYNAETDPPLQKPKGFGPASMPAEDGAGASPFRGPMGMEYNPMTGQWSGGILLGNNQVKPGCEAALPTGPRVRIDQKATVSNPDPDALHGARALRRIERSGNGPGQRPPTDPN